jgi:hypothetical protein
MRKEPRKPLEHSKLTEVEPGKMLRSFKTRPNDPCSCKSGLKVKNCCGDKSRIVTTKQLASPLPKDHYIYISTKYTHRKDQWFFFWRPKAQGYNFTREEAGIFDRAYSTTEHVFSVNVETIAPLFIATEYRKRRCHVLPNTPAVRKALGIKLSDLKSSIQYQF